MLCTTAIHLLLSRFVFRYYRQAYTRTNLKMRMRRLWTSPRQFQIMVDFIERYSSGPGGRVLSQRLWRELTNQLNSCGAGNPRPDIKWKKVWSDFKNNTKKRAAHVQRTATKTRGGSEEDAAELTELEKRVLAIMDPGREGGMEEVALEFGGDEMEEPIDKREPSSPTSPLSASDLSLESVASSGAVPQIDFNIPGCSYASPLSDLKDAPSRPAERPLSPPTAVHRRRRRLRKRLRKHWRPSTAIDRAIMLFIKANREELQYRREAESRRELEDERERLYRQEAALQHRQWMEICTRALDLLERFAPPDRE